MVEAILPRLKAVDKYMNSKEAKEAFDTEQKYALKNPDGSIKEGADGIPQYNPERQEIHRQIVQKFIDEAIANGVPKDRQAVMSGGMGGSGKGTILSTKEGIDPKQWLTVDPDEIKKELIARGLEPKIPGVQPLETATLIHEESSAISKLLTNAALTAGFNTVLDTTMASEGSTQKRIDEAKSEGYKLRAVFSDVKPGTTVERARARYAQGVADFQQGKGQGGRLVSEMYLQGSRPKGEKYASANRETLEKLRPNFDSVKIYNNDGAAPVLEK